METVLANRVTHFLLQVDTNGAISFLMPVGQYTPNAFPLDEGSRLVAPFWADIDTTVNHGRVYHRQTTNADILERASRDIRGAFVNQPRFYTTWAFVSTWYQVTYYGGNNFTNVSNNCMFCVICLVELYIVVRSIRRIQFCLYGTSARSRMYQ